MASFTEEMVLNPKHMGRIEGWRRYRIEYGFEDETPEGIVYLPSHINPDLLENFINRLIREGNNY